MVQCSITFRNVAMRRAICDPRARGYSRGMTKELGTLERAFALARSGECASVGEIRLRLKKERCDSVEAHLSGPSISKQLRMLCDEARKALPANSAVEAGA